MWRAACDVLRWLFVTLPRAVWGVACDVLHWLFVTLPRAVWRAACDVLRWLFVTLPHAVWGVAQDVLRWLFVTLPREVCLLVYAFARYLAGLAREWIRALLTALQSLWELLGDVLLYPVAALLAPAAALWFLYRRVVDDGTRSETVPLWNSRDRR